MGEGDVIRSHASGLDVDAAQKESRAILLWVGVEQLSKNRRAQIATDGGTVGLRVAPFPSGCSVPSSQGSGSVHAAAPAIILAGAYSATRCRAASNDPLKQQPYGTRMARYYPDLLLAPKARVLLAVPPSTDRHLQRDQISVSTTDGRDPSLEGFEDGTFYVLLSVHGHPLSAAYPVYDLKIADGTITGSVIPRSTWS